MRACETTRRPRPPAAWPRTGSATTASRCRTAIPPPTRRSPATWPTACVRGTRQPAARVPPRQDRVLRPGGRQLHRPPGQAGGGGRRRVRRPGVPVRQAGRALVRGRPPRDAGRQAGQDRQARPRHRPHRVRRRRLRGGPGGGPADRGGPGHQPRGAVPARRRGRLPGAAGARAGAGGVPRGDGGRQPAGDQRVGGERAVRRPRAVQGRGGGGGRAGAQHAVAGDGP